MTVLLLAFVARFLAVACGAVLVAVFTRWLVALSSSSKTKKKRRVPSWPVVPGALPWIGNFFDIGCLGNMNQKITEWADKYGKERGVFQFSIAGVTYVVVCREDTVSEVNAQRPYKIQRDPFLSRSVESLGGVGLVTAEGLLWRKDRRTVAPLLNKKHVQESFLPTIRLVSSRLVQKWKTTAAVGSSVLLYDDALRYMIDIFALAGCGEDFNSLQDPDNANAKDMARVMEFGMLRHLLGGALPYWKIPIVGQYLDGAGWSRHRLLTLFGNTVQEYEKLAEDENSPTGNENLSLMGKLVALVSKSRLERGRVVGNIITLFFAGSETSAAHLTNMVWILAMDPALQKDLAEEALKLGKLEDPAQVEFSLENLFLRMPLTRAFIYEAYRFHGPIPMLPLLATEPTTLAGTTLDPGTFLISSCCATLAGTNTAPQRGYLVVPMGSILPMNFISIGIYRSKTMVHGLYKHLKPVVPT